MTEKARETRLRSERPQENALQRNEDLGLLLGNAEANADRFMTRQEMAVRYFVRENQIMSCVFGLIREWQRSKGVQGVHTNQIIRGTRELAPTAREVQRAIDTLKARREIYSGKGEGRFLSSDYRAELIKKRVVFTGWAVEAKLYLNMAQKTLSKLNSDSSDNDIQKVADIFSVQIRFRVGYPGEIKDLFERICRRAFVASQSCNACADLCSRLLRTHMSAGVGTVGQEMKCYIVDFCKRDLEAANPAAETNRIHKLGSIRFIGALFAKNAVDVETLKIGLKGCLASDDIHTKEILGDTIDVVQQRLRRSITRHFFREWVKCTKWLKCTKFTVLPTGWESGSKRKKYMADRAQRPQCSQKLVAECFEEQEWLSDNYMHFGMVKDDNGFDSEADGSGNEEWWFDSEAGGSGNEEWWLTDVEMVGSEAPISYDGWQDHDWQQALKGCGSDWHRFTFAGASDHVWLQEADKACG
eukprot:CAMPEP_0181317990 /NCGR_PEP_ID=MMETSP1101-20121128/16766_1 /TAXON_ID=46948 /ORGANISM="Rhodomonas abbreviata, Strain Caron Lab Isolate" /LENGTH=470 /DNA_ID=CAMNT_0023425427 /DNA_START=111 /DNA_END=1523 /DNA_ORIENTATION=+